MTSQWDSYLVLIITFVVYLLHRTEVPNAYREIDRTSFSKSQREHHFYVGTPVCQLTFIGIRVDIYPIKHSKTHSKKDMPTHVLLFLQVFQGSSVAGNVESNLKPAGQAEDGSRFLIRNEIYRNDGKLVARVTGAGWTFPPVGWLHHWKVCSMHFNLKMDDFRCWHRALNR